jgi:hypothetical protein
MRRKLSELKKAMDLLDEMLNEEQRANVPLMIMAYQQGRDGETREPGVYEDGREVVFRDDAELDRLVGEMMPAGHPFRPLIIVMGPKDFGGRKPPPLPGETA